MACVQIGNDVTCRVYGCGIGLEKVNVRFTNVMTKGFYAANAILILNRLSILFHLVPCTKAQDLTTSADMPLHFTLLPRVPRFADSVVPENQCQASKNA